MRRWPIGLLAAGLVVALGTPAYIAHAVPGMRGYLLHPSIVLLQALPYLLGMVLWIPAWTAGAGGTAHVLAAGLFLMTLLVYAPFLASPERRGGDMIGIAFAGISISMTAAVVLASIVAFIVLRLRR